MKAINRTGVDYYCQVSDVEYLKKLVRSLPDNPICVNIGAALGTSTLAMLEARPDSRVCSIDIEDCPEEYKAVEDAGFMDEDRYRFYKHSSQDLGKMWHDSTVDFVFIDGGHKYKECLEDAIVWYKILKTNGIMAFHDYEAKMLSEVKEAVDFASMYLGLEKIGREGTLIAFRKVGHENLQDTD